MTTSLSQQLALISFGNSFLKTGNIHDSFYPSNSTFQFCESVQFFELKRFLFFKPTAHLMAVDPIQWLKKLKSDGCLKLQIRYEHSADQSFAKDHKMAGMVGGGGIWTIETVFKDYSHYWANNWQVKDINAPDSRIWSVKYGMVSKYQNLHDIVADLLKAKEELASSLTAIRDFAQRNYLAEWMNVFENSLSCLVSDTPWEKYYHQDMLDKIGHSLLSQQVLFSSGVAFVFGGMGSWNDIGFEKKETQDEYEVLSERLYEAIVNGIKTAINEPQIG